MVRYVYREIQGHAGYGVRAHAHLCAILAMGFEPMRTYVEKILSLPPYPLTFVGKFKKMLAMGFEPMRSYVQKILCLPP